MRKRWMQSIFIFIVIIVFAVLGYLFLKKYDATHDVVAQTDAFIFMQNAVIPLF